MRTNLERDVVSEEKNTSIIPFTLIHKPILDRLFTEVSGGAFKLYCLLRTYSDGSYKPVFPKTKTLANRLDVSQDSITNYLKELEKNHFIEIKRTPGKRSVYHFITDFKDETTRENSAQVSENCPENHPKNFGHNNYNNLELDIKSTTTEQDPGEEPSSVDVVYEQSTSKKNPQPTAKYQSQQTAPTVKNKSIPEPNPFLEQTISKYHTLKNKLPDTDTPSKPLPIDPNYISMLKASIQLELVDFCLAYSSWYITKPDSGIVNFPGWFRWLLSNANTYDFSQYMTALENKVKITEKKQTKQEYKSDLDKENEKREQQFKADQQLLGQFKIDNPERYAELEKQCEEKQMVAPMFNKPGTLSFNSMVRRQMVKWIKVSSRTENQ